MSADRTESTARSVPFGKRIASLDGIRGLAVLSVVFFNSAILTPDGTYVQKVYSFFKETAWCGVDLFFVLSGFLITGILIDSKGRPGYFRNFYARRTLRIMPLYYSILIAVLVILPRVYRGIHESGYFQQLARHQLWLWFYLQNYLQASGAHTLPGFGHFWTLAVEEQFYWVWPVLVFLLSRRSLLWTGITVCVLSPVLRVVLLHEGFTTWAIRSLTYTRLDSLVYGAVIAILIREAAIAPRMVRAAQGLLALALVTLLVIASWHGFIPYEGRETVAVGYSAMGIVFASLIFICGRGNNPVSAFFGNPVLRWFGRYSYAIYIFHDWFAEGLQAAVDKYHIASNPLTAFAQFLIVLACASVASFVSWNLLERHFLKLKGRFEYQEKPQLATS